jgi:catechol O-methyltransferase
MDSTPFFYRHMAKNVLLIALSVIALPISTAILAACWILIPSVTKNKHEESRKTILVTGVSMSKGLTMSRLLARYTPHRIIGADIEPIPFTSPGRYSHSISEFFRLEPPKEEDAKPYINCLLSVLEKEKVDLWIPCSSVGSAVTDGIIARLATEKLGSTFRSIQFPPEVVRKLDDKASFMSYIASLGLRTPESHRCTAVDDVMRILFPPKKEKNKFAMPHKYILKPLGVDDRARARMMTPLPLGTRKLTEAYLHDLGVSKKNPFQLQQLISGSEYCTHALIVHGVVRAFTACPSSDLLMHYKPLHPSSKIHREMLQFTQKVAEHKGISFTGHMAFDFLVHGEGDNIEIYPIECNPRVHTAVVLFSEMPEMAHALLEVPVNNPSTAVDVIFPQKLDSGYYWIGHDLVTLFIIPVLEMLMGYATWQSCKMDLKKFLRHLRYWSDGTFSLWDPLPFWVLYHVYWPAQFVRSLLYNKPWSR